MALRRSESSHTISTMIPRLRVRLAAAGLLLGVALVLVSGGAAGGALNRSGGAISAHLARTSFKAAEAGTVKLVYRFSRPSTHFALLLTRRSGAKWLQLRSVGQKGRFSGRHTLTIAKLFAGKPIKTGSYRLKLTADGSNALLAFTVTAAATGPRTIRFSGYSWRVKASETGVGPGPNLFSGRPGDVWVDALGRLHLRIVKRDGRWYCSGVYSSEAFGYGTYTFTLAGPVDRIDENAVLGLFTWDDNAPQFAYREIDIELSRWGDEAAANAQFVVQPWEHAGNMHRFEMTPSGDFSTQSFQWGADHILFSSRQGREPSPGDTIETWSYTGADIPPPGDGHARINLWLTNGIPPSNGQNVEVVVDSFRFTPAT